MPSRVRIFLALSKFIFTKSIGDLNTPLERPIRALAASNKLSFEGNPNGFQILL